MFEPLHHLHDLSTSMPAMSLLSMTLFDRSGLWMLGGFLMLGWVLARTTVQRRKRRVHQSQEDREMKMRMQSTKSSALPLSDAPPETQRWQVAMFDLQRELKGELDSRIAVTQSLIRQLDQRIATIERLEEK
jgi:hypothetical protein